MDSNQKLEDGTKSYHLNDLSKYKNTSASQDVQTAPFPSAGSVIMKKDSIGGRPCAIVGPDEGVPLLKENAPSGWAPAHVRHAQPQSYANVPHYHQVSYVPEAQHPPRNISPRHTFQENMSRFIVPSPHAVKSRANPHAPPELHHPSPVPSSVYHTPSGLYNVAKINLSPNVKYCEGSVIVSPSGTEPLRSQYSKNNDLSVRKYELAGPKYPVHSYHVSGLQESIYGSYGNGHVPSERQKYVEIPSHAIPRIKSNQVYHKIPEGHPHYYPVSNEFNINQYGRGNVRYEPYPPPVKERHVVAPRYDYPYQYPNHTVIQNNPEIRKSNVLPAPDMRYYPIPHKYPEPQSSELYSKVSVRRNQVNVPYASEVPTYPIDAYGNPSKMYGFNIYDKASSRLPPEANRAKINYHNQYVNYPNFDPRYHENVDTTKLQMPLPPAPPNYQAKPHEIPAGYAINSNTFSKPTEVHYPNRNPEFYNYQKSYYMPRQFSYNPLARVPTDFSPNIISPTESNTSNESMTAASSQILQEDGGYVSQCSTTSGQSGDIHHNYLGNCYENNPNEACLRPTATKLNYQYIPETIKPEDKLAKQKSSLDVRQFLQMWVEDEEFDDNKATETPAKENIKIIENIQVCANPTQPEQLYVLDKVTIRADELHKYDHIPKITKLPDNIKEREEPAGNQKVQYECDKAASKQPVKLNVESQVLNVTKPHSLSTNESEAIDVEEKISQSVISKEKGGYGFKYSSLDMNNPVQIEILPSPSVQFESFESKAVQPQPQKRAYNKSENKERQRNSKYNKNAVLNVAGSPEKIPKLETNSPIIYNQQYHQPPVRGNESVRPKMNDVLQSNIMVSQSESVYPVTRYLPPLELYNNFEKSAFLNHLDEAEKHPSVNTAIQHIHTNSYLENNQLFGPSKFDASLMPSDGLGALKGASNPLHVNIGRTEIPSKSKLPKRSSLEETKLTESNSETALDSDRAEEVCKVDTRLDPNAFGRCNVYTKEYLHKNDNNQNENHAPFPESNIKVNPNYVSKKHEAVNESCEKNEEKGDAIKESGGAFVSDSKKVENVTVLSCGNSVGVDLCMNKDLGDDNDGEDSPMNLCSSECNKGKDKRSCLEGNDQRNVEIDKSMNDSKVRGKKCLPNYGFEETDRFAGDCNFKGIEMPVSKDENITIASQSSLPSAVCSSILKDEPSKLPLKDVDLLNPNSSVPADLSVLTDNVEPILGIASNKISLESDVDNLTLSTNDALNPLACDDFLNDAISINTNSDFSIVHEILPMIETTDKCLMDVIEPSSIDNIQGCDKEKRSSPIVVESRELLVNASQIATMSSAKYVQNCDKTGVLLDLLAPNLVTELSNDKITENIAVLSNPETNTDNVLPIEVKAMEETLKEIDFVHDDKVLIQETVVNNDEHLKIDTASLETTDNVLPIEVKAIEETLKKIDSVHDNTGFIQESDANHDEYSKIDTASLETKILNRSFCSVGVENLDRVVEISIPETETIVSPESYFAVHEDDDSTVSVDHDVALSSNGNNIETKADQPDEIVETASEEMEVYKSPESCFAVHADETADVVNHDKANENVDKENQPDEIVSLGTQTSKSPVLHFDENQDEARCGNVSVAMKEESDVAVQIAIPETEMCESPESYFAVNADDGEATTNHGEELSSDTNEVVTKEDQCDEAMEIAIPETETLKSSESCFTECAVDSTVSNKCDEALITNENEGISKTDQCDDVVSEEETIDSPEIYNAVDHDGSVSRKDQLDEVEIAIPETETVKSPELYFAEHADESTVIFNHDDENIKKENQPDVVVEIAIEETEICKSPESYFAVNVDDSKVNVHDENISKKDPSDAVEIETIPGTEKYRPPESYFAELANDSEIIVGHHEKDSSDGSVRKTNELNEAVEIAIPETQNNSPESYFAVHANDSTAIADHDDKSNRRKDHPDAVEVAVQETEIYKSPKSYFAVHDDDGSAIVDHDDGNVTKLQQLDEIVEIASPETANYRPPESYFAELIDDSRASVNHDDEIVSRKNQPNEIDVTETYDSPESYFALHADDSTTILNHDELLTSDEIGSNIRESDEIYLINDFDLAVQANFDSESPIHVTIMDEPQILNNEISENDSDSENSFENCSETYLSKSVLVKSDYKLSSVSLTPDSDSTLVEDNAGNDEIGENGETNTDVNGLEVGGCWIDDIACVETVICEETVDPVEEVTIPEDTLTLQLLQMHSPCSESSSPKRQMSAEGDCKNHETLLTDSNSNIIDALKGNATFDNQEAVQVIRNDEMMPQNGVKKVKKFKSFKEHLKELKRKKRLERMNEMLSRKDESCRLDDENCTSYDNGETLKNTVFKSSGENVKSKNVKSNGSSRVSTENSLFSTSQKHFMNGKILTKAAQKYIPPLEVNEREVKIHVSIPKEKLTLSNLNLKTNHDVSNSKIDFRPIGNSCRRRTVSVPRPVKVKQNFEDVLKSIDERITKITVEKLKKSVPKMVIKKDTKGSHYASCSSQNEKRSTPDLTGSKWQPLVCLTRSAHIEDMVKILCKTYITSPKRPKNTVPPLILSNKGCIVKIKKNHIKSPLFFNKKISPFLL